MKTTTLNSVKFAALFLIEAHGETTTLDVKKRLRQEGYWATQSQVSGLMMQAADELPLQWDDNSIHRIYKLPEVSSAQTQPSKRSSHDPTSMSGAPITYVKRNGQYVHGTDSPTDANNWEATEYNDDTRPLYFDSDQYTRDEARQAYAYHRNVPFSDVRARKMIARDYSQSTNMSDTQIQRVFYIFE